MIAQPASNVVSLFPKAPKLTLQQKFNLLHFRYTHCALAVKYNYRDFVEMVVLRIADIDAEAFENQAMMVHYKGKNLPALYLDGIAYLCVGENEILVLDGEAPSEPIYQDCVLQEMVEEATSMLFDRYLDLSEQGKLY